MLCHYHGTQSTSPVSLTKFSFITSILYCLYFFGSLTNFSYKINLLYLSLLITYDRTLGPITQSISSGILHYIDVYFFLYVKPEEI